MSSKVDPLLALVVDTKQVNRDALAAILQGRVFLDLTTDSFQLAAEVRAHASARQAVILSLLARKALSLLKEGIEEGLSPKELAALSGIRGNTIRPVLKRLTEDGLIMRTGARYLIHNSSLEIANSELAALGK